MMLPVFNFIKTYGLEIGACLEQDRHIELLACWVTENLTETQQIVLDFQGQRAQDYALEQLYTSVLKRTQSNDVMQLRFFKNFRITNCVSVLLNSERIRKAWFGTRKRVAIGGIVDNEFFIPHFHNSPITLLDGNIRIEEDIIYLEWTEDAESSPANYVDFVHVYVPEYPSLPRTLVFFEGAKDLVIPFERMTVNFMYSSWLGTDYIRIGERHLR